MEIIIRKDVLNESLRKVARAINSRPVVPVLSGVHILANNDEVIITGSDSNLSIRTIIKNDEENESLEIIKDGNIVLPAKELLGISRSMPEQEISIAVQEGLKVRISSGKSKFTLNGIDGDEYPRLPNVDSKGFTVNGSELSDFIEKTVYAVSKMETRPILTGVNLFFENNKIGFVATDSHRLSKVVGGEFEGDKLEDAITIPEKTLKELPRILKGTKKVTVSRKNNQISLKTDNDYILSRLMEGNFPETDRLIPQDYSTLLTVDREGFLSAMERSSILSDSEMNSVTFKIDDESDGIFKTIELSHKNSELGQSKEDIIVEEIEGEAITISFNSVFMIDALKRIQEDTVVIEFNGNMRPFIIKGATNPDFIQLVLPVRTY